MLFRLSPRTKSKRRRIILEPLEERIVFDAAPDVTFAPDMFPEADLASAVSGWYGKQVPECFADTNADFHGPKESPDPLTDPDCATISIMGDFNDGNTHKLYMGFNAGCANCAALPDNTPCDQGWGQNNNYTMADFPGFQVADGQRCNVLWQALPSDGTPINVDLKKDGRISVNFSVDQYPWEGCAVTQAEFTLNDYWGFTKSEHDTYDISLVNGFNNGVTIITPYGETLEALTATGHSKTFGVFPLGRTDCTIDCDSPCPGIVDPAEVKECGAGTANCPPTQNCQPRPAEVCQVQHDQSLDLKKPQHFDVTFHPAQ